MSYPSLNQLETRRRLIEMELTATRRPDPARVVPRSRRRRLRLLRPPYRIAAA